MTAQGLSRAQQAGGPLRLAPRCCECYVPIQPIPPGTVAGAKEAVQLVQEEQEPARS